MILVYLHGRNQQGKDWRLLRTRWTAALNNGLAENKRPLVDDNEVVFPFYGDVLYQEKAKAIKDHLDIGLERVPLLEMAQMDPLVPEKVAQTESAILYSMAQEAALPETQEEGPWESVLQLPFARRIAQALADHTRVDQEIIESFLQDVAVYLEVARKPVLNLVRDSLPSDGELVILAHSLGGAVARDLLADDAIRSRTRALVTLGAPLGLEGVYRNLEPPGTKHPGVSAWLTVWDPLDFVALGHPIKKLYGEPLTEEQVRNPFGKGGCPGSRRS